MRYRFLFSIGLLLLCFCASGCKISGKITFNGEGLEKTWVLVSGPMTDKHETNDKGEYEISDLEKGTYLVTPMKSGYWFSPESRTVTISDTETASNVNFTAIAQNGVIRVPQDYSTIGGGLAAAYPGDTVLVGDGEYVESLVLDKKLTLISVNGASSTVIRAPADHEGPVVIMKADDLVVEGFTVIGTGETGIFLGNSGESEEWAHGTISGNIVQGTRLGIWALGGGRAIINNRCQGLAGGETFGIRVDSTRGDTVSGNVCNNGSLGIFLNNPEDVEAETMVRGNTCIGNMTGMKIRGAGIKILENACSGNSASSLDIEGKGFVITGNSFEGGLTPGYVFSDVYFNSFIGNSVGHVVGTVRYSSPRSMYRYGDNVFANSMGNYFSAHTSTDSDGDGIADDPYIFEPGVEIPALMGPVTDYQVIFTGNGLSGKVVREDGEPISGADVTLLKPDNGTETYVTDEEGLFSFETEASGSHKLSVVIGGYSFRTAEYEVNFNYDEEGASVSCADFVGSLPQNREVPGDYPTIQDAVDASNPGDSVWVAPGSYNENVHVNKALFLRCGDENSFVSLNAAVPERAVLILTADQVTVEGFSLQGGQGRIVLAGASNTDTPFYGTTRFCSVKRNLCSEIVLYGGGESSVTGNKGTNSDSTGLRIRLYASNGNTVSENIISSGGDTGILVEGSTGNSIIKNEIRGNLSGLKITGSSGNVFYLNLFENNSSQNVWAVDGDLQNNFQSAQSFTYTYKFLRHTRRMGNYFDDNTASDSNDDGIRDSAYVILDPVAVDLYPLAAKPAAYVFTPN